MRAVQSGLQPKSVVPILGAVRCLTCRRTPEEATCWWKPVATRGGSVSKGSSLPVQCRSLSSSAEANDMPEAWRRPLKAINESTKWVVSAAAATVLLTRRDLAAVWCILGSLVNVIVCKVLKLIIRAERPSNAVKTDHGMPSSHAQGLAYLSVYAAVSLNTSSMLGPYTHAAAGVLLALGIFMAWLRIASGYHTTPQVVVGYVLGAAVAWAWRDLGVTHVIPTATGGQVTCIYGLTALAVLAFAGKNILGARQDIERLKRVIE